MSTHFIPEDLLRHLWSKHYLSSESLSTLDGAPVVVQECGVLNRESGPDFHNAVVVIGGTTFRGDVEFHRSIQDWQSHRHEKNPRYNRVILHVILNEPDRPVPTMSESGRSIPVLVLSGALTVPIEKLGDSLAREEYRSHAGAIPCFRMNDACSSARLTSWLSVLASERLNAKTERLYRRLCEMHSDAEMLPPEAPMRPNDAALRDAGLWEQLLYEAVMDCLGYSKNRAPFGALAREVSVSRLKNMASVTELPLFEIQAMLFTFSGLLPDVNDVEDQPSKVIVHQLHSAWSAVREQLRLHHAEALASLPPHHKAEWTFVPTRPSNFPTVRLAAAGVIANRIVAEEFFKRLIAIVAGRYVSPEIKRAQLRQAFDPAPDPFWSFHYSFTEGSSQPHALIGTARIDDIIVNAIIPIAYLYGRIFGRPEICEHTLNIAREMPLLEDNGILRKMEKQLFQGKITMTTAFQQQGAIQLYKEYCVPKRCCECEVGKEITKAVHS